MTNTTFKFGNKVDINRQSFQQAVKLTMPFTGYASNKLLKQVEQYLEAWLADNPNAIDAESFKLAQQLDKQGFAGKVFDNIRLDIAKSYTDWLVSFVAESACFDGLILDTDSPYEAVLEGSQGGLGKDNIVVYLPSEFLPSIDDIDCIYAGFKTDLLILADAHFGADGLGGLVNPNILQGQDTASHIYANEHYASLVFELLCYHVFIVDSVTDIEDMFLDMCDSDALYSHLYDRHNTNSGLVYKALGFDEV